MLQISKILFQIFLAKWSASVLAFMNREIASDAVHGHRFLYPHIIKLFHVVGNTGSIPGSWIVLVNIKFAAKATYFEQMANSVQIKHESEIHAPAPMHGRMICMQQDKIHSSSLQHEPST